ncbi:predicted protein [Plenodomus lingam JN3]|uniref:Predicted protein n=1 Tax=Leptosphaeria maculans (strain JN3 / isolate v23.1.3 / race Av1-4-5-6-7-8) TaxID=985895 RepID=E4ZYA9_LEPMJ|nr:predicted protein [Plenodomus lingam JN3]CBX96354.1 predicted protein [Plenodomus lingam JN3]
MARYSMKSANKGCCIVCSDRENSREWRAARTRFAVAETSIAAGYVLDDDHN